jgi:hypothetical protein
MVSGQGIAPVTLTQKVEIAPLLVPRWGVMYR